MNPTPSTHSAIKQDASYLVITISDAIDAFIPGYDGDSRVSWNVLPTPDINLALTQTQLSLHTLNQFWESTTSNGLHFDSFLEMVSNAYSDHYQDSLADDENEAKSTEQVIEPKTMTIIELATFLVNNPDSFPAFLTDLRDWDAFRLLLRRHSTKVLQLVPFKTQITSTNALSTLQQQAQQINDVTLENEGLKAQLEDERKLFIDSVYGSHLQIHSLLGLFKAQTRGSQNIETFKSSLKKKVSFNEVVKVQERRLQKEEGEDELELESGSIDSDTKKGNDDDTVSNSEDESMILKYPSNTKHLDNQFCTIQEERIDLGLGCLESKGSSEEFEEKKKEKWSSKLMKKLSVSNMNIG